MVKRIKKRVTKQPEETEAEVGGLDEQGADDASAAPSASSFRAELESLGEDEFTRRVAGGVSWIVDNRGLIITGVVLAAAAVIAIVVFQGQKRSGSEEASTAFYDAAETYGEAHARPAPGSTEPTLTPEQRKAQVEKAQQGFARTRTTYGETPVAALAALGEATTQLELGDAAAAAKLYDAALGDTDLEPFAKAIALQGKAAALEQTGDLAGAVETWKALEGLNRDAYGLLAGMQMGRLYEAQGKGGEAKALYERVKTDHAASLDELPNRGLKAELDKRLARLGDAS